MDLDVGIIETQVINIYNKINFSYIELTTITCNDMLDLNESNVKLKQVTTELSWCYQVRKEGKIR